MLPSTFRHIKGISAKKEAQLWRVGVLTWDDLEGRLNPQYSLFSDATRPTESLNLIRLSKEAYRVGNADFFAQYLDRQEHYRIALEYPNDTLFLDIETTGLSRYYDYITLIGWSIGGEYDVYVRGDSDEKLRAALSRAKTVVTFNGTIFDLPFVRQEFREVSIPKAHVDLRFLSRRAGLSGGQKAIEESIGLQRGSEIKEMTGEGAPVLWHRYRRGDLKALKLLIEYNHADIEGMKHIFDYTVTKLAKEQHWPKSSNGLTRFSDLESELRWVANSRLSSGTEIVPYSEEARPAINIDDLILTDREPRLCVVGIDLTGHESRKSGWCALEGRSATTRELGTDREIISETIKVRPYLVSIDSPLSLPTGRTSVDDSDPGREKYGIMRYCERVLKKRGVNVYPALIPSMQKLTARGIRLANKFRSLGLPVIESYPGAAQDVMNIPRKRASIEFLERGLAEFGIEGDFIVNPVSHDQLDAITSAIVGVFFWSGKFEKLGDGRYGEEALIIPDLTVDPTKWRGRIVVGVSGPVAAGKTTAAQYLAQRGFSYGRYSQVIEQIARESNRLPSKKMLQNVGRDVNKRFGQRWLGRKLLQMLPAEGNLVIDGVRFKEDHAFLVEVFGPAYFHMHVTAPFQVREKRYKAREGRGADFKKIDSHPVERHAGELRELAMVVENVSSIAALESEIDAILDAN